MIAIKPFLGTVAVLTTFGVLAACGGAGTAPSANGIPAGAPGGAPLTRFVGPGATSPDAASCTSKGGVSVSPCPVTLTDSNPTSAETVTAPASSTISVQDKKCTKKSIAEVEGSGDTWDVTAGTTEGNCSAKFTAKDSKGKKVGDAILPITNKV